MDKEYRLYYKLYYTIWIAFIVIVVLSIRTFKINFVYFGMMYFAWYMFVLIFEQNRLRKVIKRQFPELYQEIGNVTPWQNYFRWRRVIFSTNKKDKTIAIIKYNFRLIEILHILHILTIPIISYILNYITLV